MAIQSAIQFTNVAPDTVVTPPTGYFSWFQSTGATATLSPGSPTTIANAVYRLDSSRNLLLFVAGAVTVSNVDGTLTISPTSGAVIASRAAITGDVSVPAGSDVATLASTITAGGPTGSATQVAQITYDAKGRLTAVTAVSIQITESQVTNLVSDLAGKQPTGNYITALTGDVTATGPGSATATLAAFGPGTSTVGDASHVAQVTPDAKGRINTLVAVLIQIAESQVTNLVSDLAGKVPTTRLINTTAPLTGGGDLSADRTIAMPAATVAQAGYVSTATQGFGGAKVFKDLDGVCYIDAANTLGWAGADVGAWINSAYSYLITTYGTVFAGPPSGFTGVGVIQLGPGVFTYTTPIVLADQWFSIKLRGCGEGLALTPAGSAGKGGTVLNYTPTSGIALNIAGASSNNGGVQIEDLALFGGTVGSVAVVPGGTAIGIQWGLTGGAPPPGSSTAGATCKNVAIAQFAIGELWQATGSIAYAVQHYNCKVQFCATGVKPFGEANNWYGGLIGACTTGCDHTNGGTDASYYGVAFDDNTTQAINQTAQTFRTNLIGCRFENAGGGTDLYITQTNGSIVVSGGTMQSDITTGTSTGFANLSGGKFYLTGTWLFGQGTRVFTQAFNTSGTILAHIDPQIGPGSVGISQICTAAYAGTPRRLDWTRLSNRSSAVQAIAALGVIPGTYLTGSVLALPNPLEVGPVASTAFEWSWVMNKSAVGTGNFSFIIFGGTAGSTADTQLITINITQTAVLDKAVITLQMVVNAGGATGTATAIVSGFQVAATATGFGFTTGAPGPAAVTSGAFNFTTAGLKFGVGIASAAGTPAINISNVQAKSYNLD